MLTEQWKADRKCCLYTSDFHLEMILLPYIKNRIDQSDFVIMTQKDLDETINILLDRVNLNKQEKDKIYSLNWKNDDVNKMKKIYSRTEEKKELSVIINGDRDYMKSIHNKLNILDNKKINIVDCFCIIDEEIQKEEITRDYKEILNTTKI